MKHRGEHLENGVLFWLTEAKNVNGRDERVKVLAVVLILNLKAPALENSNI